MALQEIVVRRQDGTGRGKRRCCLLAAFHHSRGSSLSAASEGAWGYFISGFLLGDLLFVPRHVHFSWLMWCSCDPAGQSLGERQEWQRE